MTSDDDRAELQALIAARSFKTGAFTLSSGKTSTRYFNLKPTMMHPRGAELTARAMLDVAERLGVSHVSGLEMGAVPLIAAMAALSARDGAPLSTSFVRKRVKEHGTKDLIEGLAPGESLAGVRVLAIDDVATSGASTLQAIEEIRAAGGIVEHAACIVSRGEGGEELMRANGVTLHALFHAHAFDGAPADA